MVKGLLRKSFVILFVFCTVQKVHAQAPINFTALETKDGLSSNIINVILKDRYGLMWFATEDGLNKFDGTNFTVYRHNFNDSTSLPANEVVALHEDKAGNLWVGTTNGGCLSLYDRKKDSFINFKSASILNSGLESVSSDYLGKIWVGTYGGFSIVDPETRNISEFSVVKTQKGRQRTEAVVCLFEDSRHRMWVGTNKGLFLYQRQSKSFEQFSHSDSDPQSLISNSVKALAEDKNGNLWIGTTEGLSMLMPDGRNFRNFNRQNTPVLSSDIIYSVAVDNEGKLWLGTEEGLNIFDVKSSAIRVLRPDKRNNYSLTSKSVRCVYIDKQGIYWLGTYQGGVNKYDKNLTLFNLKQSNAFDASSLSGPVVTSFAEDINGNVYVGTDGGGLNLFNRKTGLFRHFPIRAESKGADKNLSILTMEMSRDKHLWIGTYLDGLFVFDPVTGRYQQFTRGKNAGDLNSNDIFCIKEDRHGNIWIGTNGGGLNVYNPTSKKFIIYTSQSVSGVPGFPLNGYIRAIEEDRKGNIWVGSHGAGLAVWSPLSKKFTAYNRGNSQLPSNVVLSIFADSKENIWVGTVGGGLSLLDRKTGKFISFTEKDGLENAVVYKIMEDGKGRLWLSTNKGISSFDVKTKRFSNYTYHNGLQNNNFVRGAGIRLSDGELFFGGLDGFNYFDPSELKQNKNIPSIILTDLKVANQSVTASENAPIKQQISVAKEINLDYKQNFSLSFIALNYTIPQQNKYAYKLEGFDKDWNYVGTSTTASYTNLDPGEYIFRVKASNNDGVWNTSGISIKVNVKPPFWLTIYAYLFYAAAIIGILFLLRYRAYRKLRMRFALEQERKEAERMHELDQLKIKFLTNLSHEFRTPISLIMGPVDNLLSHEKDEERSGQLYMIKRNARRLLNLVNQLLDFRRMEEQELRLNLSKGELIGFIKEVADSFKDLSERKKINFVFSSRVRSLYTLFDQDKIERILFNLLSNAFKFTQGEGAVRLEVEEAEGTSKANKTWLTIKVIDSGIGIPETKKEKIFERFFQSSSSSAILNQGSGIGLSITKEFVEMHGGSVQVESEAGRGSTFIIHMPFTEMQPQEEERPLECSEPERLPAAGPEPETAEINNTDTELPSVLLVEDNDDFRFYLKDNLKSDYKIIEACNGKEGWQKALSNHPQLIVSDISMPYMDGIELSRKIKSDKRTCHIPVILLTALTAEEEQVKGLTTGANDYMTKPFNFEILNAKIKNLLNLNLTLKNTYSKQIKVIATEVEIESTDEKFLNRVALYIEENLNNPKLSVEDLSRHVGMSRGSLYHKLLELTGQSPVEYIRSVKLEKAAVLLEKSDMNIAQIAYMAGFATPNYFAKSFKAKFNMLPSEFLNSRRKSADKIKSA